MGLCTNTDPILVGKQERKWTITMEHMLRAAAGTRAAHTDSAQGVRAGEIPLGRCCSEGKKVSLVMFTVE